VASWFDRWKPLKSRAGLDLMTSAALLLFFSGAEALAEDEPAARAPLPPPSRGAPAETGERQMPDPAPSRNQSDPGAPATRFDPQRSQLPQKKPRLHSASYLGASMAKKREMPPRLGKHSIDAVALRQGHRTVASEKRRERSPTEPEIGSLSAPSDYPDPRIGNATVPPGDPRQAPPLYNPNYFAGPPAYGYAPIYPYAWAPAGPRVFR
jgi:hypothetical protein